MEVARTLTFELEYRDIQFVCRDCGKMIRCRMQMPAGFPTLVPERCDICTETEQQRRNEAALSAAWRRRSEESGIPPEFIDWSREKGNIELMTFIWSNRHKSLFIVDDYGVGKSRAMAAAAAKMLRNEPQWRIQFWSFSDLATTYSRLMQDGIAEAERFKKRIFKMDLLVIDDVGKKRITDSAADIFYSVMDNRCTTGKSVWISQNVSAGEMIAKFPDRDGGDTGTAIYDRCRRMMDDGVMIKWEAKK